MQLYIVHMNSLHSRWCMDGNPPYLLKMLFSDLYDCKVYAVTKLFQSHHDL